MTAAARRSASTGDSGLSRDYGGASICEHGRRRAQCRDCGGTSVCEHGRRRAHCRECGGTSVCEHGRRRAHCRECGGSSFCVHGRRRAHCRDCSNFVCQIEGCPWQDLPFSGAQSLLKHMQTVHGDNPRSVTKSKELEVHQALRDAQIAFEYQHHLPFRGCGLESETAHAYADFALPAPWGYVLLEVDEEQHKAYDPSCDVRRDFDMAASVALGSGHKLLVLRYNPDAFKIAGVTRRTTKKERHAQLIRLLAGCWRAGRRRLSPASFSSTTGPRRTTRCPAWRSTGPSPCAPCHAAPRVPKFEAGKPGGESVSALLHSRTLTEFSGQSGRRVWGRSAVQHCASSVFWETPGQSCAHARIDGRACEW